MIWFSDLSICSLYIPASIEDQDYNGLEMAPEGLCVEHRLPTERHVAFESFETGRRFLVCAQPVSH